jgi:hypothetical protein
LVVWSHGGGFNQAGHKQAAEWGTTLAKHGYAVLHVAHVPPTLESAAALCELGSVPPADCTVDAASDEDDNGLIALVKTLDVIAVLDRLPQLSEASVEPSPVGRLEHAPPSSRTELAFKRCPTSSPSR